MITREDCELVLKKFLKTEDVEPSKFDVTQCGDKNYRLKITANCDNQERIYHFFAKTSNNDLIKTNDINKIIHKDFKRALPKFEAKITPKIYHGNAELLIFEDLASKGFHTLSDLFCVKQLEMVLKILARFHAASLAYEETKSKELDTTFRLMSTANNLADLLNERREWLKETDELNTFIDYIQNVDTLKLANCRQTLCHGNLISENIMFKVRDGLPIDCKLINFKSKCYMLPAYDVLQVIYFNSSKDLRQHHFEHLLSYYHRCLEEELGIHCLKLQQIFSLDELKATSNYILPLIKFETADLRYSLKQQSNLLADAVQEVKELLLNPRLSREDCYQIVKNKLGTTSYQLKSFALNPLEEVKGYLGEYFKLKIEIGHLGEDKTLNCFIKALPKGAQAKNLATDINSFDKEVFVYQKIIGMMHEVGLSEIDECITKCYFQKPGDIVAFEDVSLFGYKTLNPQISFTFELLAMSMRKLAQYHACSIALEEKMTQQLGHEFRLDQHYGLYLKEVFFLEAENHLGADLMSSGLRSVIPVTNLFPELKTDSNQAKLQQHFGEFSKRFYEAVKPSKKLRNVLSHGDLWTNNIMVLMENEQPIDCLFVDFQCTRYCPPAHDFLSVLYLTTDHDVRIQYEQQLIEIYYEQFSDTLASHNLDAEKIYSFNEFVENIEFVRPQMVLQSIMYGMFAVCTSDEIKYITENNENCQQIFFGDRTEYLNRMFKKSEPFRRKMRSCVLSLYDLCNNFV